MMNKLEYRAVSEIRAVEDSEKMVIEGVVNNIGEWSKVLGGTFRERIEPGVFTRAIERAVKDNDIFFLHQHDNRSLPLASVNSDTLELVEKDNQLKMRAELTDTSFSRDIYSLVKQGVLREFSFGFSNPKSKWTTGKDKIKERSLTDFNLHEISIVRVGAYNHTQAYARAYEEMEAENSNNTEDLYKYNKNKLKLNSIR